MSESNVYPYKSKDTRLLLLTALSTIVALIASLTAFFLYKLIGLLTNIFYYGRISFTLSNPTPEMFGPIIILIPAVGGLIAGLMIKYGSPKIIGHGIPEAMEAILTNKSKIKPKVGILKAISAAFTIGSGQPFGAEGPIIQTGSAIGSFVGQELPITAKERKILLSCGAAAGMAATFGTPVAGILITLELLLFEFNTKNFVPIGVSSAIGAGFHIVLISSKPLFSVPAYNYDHVAIIPLCIVLGAICGLIGYGMTKLLYLTEDMFLKMPLKQPLRPALGGLFVGLVGFFIPQILGVGYDYISQMLSGNIVLTLVIFIFLAKSATWIIAMGSRTSGGTLAPLFLVGSSFGLMFGEIAKLVFPELQVDPGIFALAALAAVFGSAAKAPLTSIVFSVEVTDQFHALIPIIITVLIADLITEYLLNFSIMSEKLARRDLFTHNIYEVNPWREKRLSQVMNEPLYIIDLEKSSNKDKEVKKIYDKHSKKKTKKPIFFSKDGEIKGFINFHKYLDVKKDDFKSFKPEEQLDSRIAYMSMGHTLFEASKVILLDNIAYLIVLNDNRDPIGYISQEDLFNTWKQKLIYDYST